mmetsp:Transcript_6282/g.7669  ORF Transcript_6282/g.7669 Transcript_6282/m.7669 type:complete len:256 (-) Transcript_6282:200-967(-)
MNIQSQYQEEINVATLKKLDPSITEVIATSSHASMYQFETSAVKWEKIECEGPLFIVKRNSDPRFGLIIANRVGLENFIHGIDSSFHIELVEPYLIFKSVSNSNESPIIRGLWLSDDNERATIFQVLKKCVKAQSVQQSQSVFQSTPAIVQQQNPIEVMKSLTNEVPQKDIMKAKEQPSTQMNNNSESVQEDQGLLTPAMILGEKNVPKLGCQQGIGQGGQPVDMNLFKEALRDLLEDDVFLSSLHSKYTEVVTR